MFPNLFTVPNICVATDTCPKEMQSLMILTCIPFLIIGLYIALKNEAKISILFGSLIIFTGSSALYLHLYWNLLGQLVDFLFICLLCIYPEVFLLKIPSKTKILVFLLISMGFVLISMFNQLVIFGMFIAMVISFVVFRHNKRENLLYKSYQLFLIFIIGLLFWLLGDYQMKLGITIALPFHSIWHIISVIGIYRFYKYYTSNIKEVQFEKL